MMDYFLDNWGSFVSAFGVIISIGGFAIAIWQATRARTSAEAAETASKQTRDAIARVLTVGDLSRAIELIQRIKDFHRDQKWEVSLQHYQILRATITDIRGRLPSTMSEIDVTLRDAVPQIKAIEDSVDRAIIEGIEPDGLGNFNGVLNTIQADLEGIASSTNFSYSEAGR